jgi:hypothetical protein
MPIKAGAHPVRVDDHGTYAPPPRGAAPIESHGTYSPAPRATLSPSWQRTVDKLTAEFNAKHPELTKP